MMENCCIKKEEPRRCKRCVMPETKGRVDIDENGLVIYAGRGKKIILRLRRRTKRRVYHILRRSYFFIPNHLLNMIVL